MPNQTSTIHHLLQIAAPPEAVFRALTTEEGLSGWWTTKVRAETAAVGADVRFTFGGPFNPRLRISELQPSARVAWEGVSGHEAWGATTIRFALEPAGEGTLVRFWHTLAPARGEDGVAAANFNWGYYLDSLRLLCETGRGKPYPAGTPGARVGADRLNGS